MLCSRMSSRRVCEESPSKGKSGTSKRAVHSSRHPSLISWGLICEFSRQPDRVKFLSCKEFFHHQKCRRAQCRHLCHPRREHVPTLRGYKFLRCLSQMAASSDTELILAEVKGLFNWTPRLVLRNSKKQILNRNASAFIL
jgi:hypothetical protein